MNIPRNLPTLPALAAMAALAGCDKDSKVFSTADLGAERSVVAGRVTGIGDSGVSGVVVSAQAVDEVGKVRSDVPAMTSLSGDQGRFSLELRPGLRWKISWQSPDYKTPGNGDIVDLGLRQVVQLPAAKRLTYRYGWVVGVTTPHAAVSIDGQDAATVANDKGVFKLERVVPGKIDIISMLPGKGYGRVRDSLAPEGIDTVVLTTLRPLSSVSGSLTNQDGSPQAGAILSAMGGLVRDTTDAQGRFHLDNLPAKGRVQVQVDRGLGVTDRLLLPTAPEDSSWDLGPLPVSGTVAGPGVRVSSGVVVADSGDLIDIPLLWDLLDKDRTVIGFAWDTTGTGQPGLALRTWGPRLTNIPVGGRSHAISAWVTVASPLSDGGFDTLWSSEARVNLIVRQKPKAQDSLAAPSFSHAPGAYPAPLRIGLTDSDSLAAILWSTDSVQWTAWDGDSIVLYDTATVWAHARRKGFADSKIAKARFLVRPSALPETLKTPIAGTVRLPKGSLFKAYACPTLNTDAQLVLDTGASLELPSGCTFGVDQGATLELRAGSKLVMGAGANLSVGYGSIGRLLVVGSTGRRASIVSKDPSNPMGASSGAINLYGFAGGSRISGLDLDGAKGSGIYVSDVELDIVSSRLRNCAAAGIEFHGTARPASEDGIADDSTSSCRWSLRTTPYALGRVATNPGFRDTILVNLAGAPTENSHWRPQTLPLRIEIEVDVQANATLTLDPGLALAMGADGSFSVGYSSAGTLVVDGTPSNPVVIRPVNPNLGWGYGRGTAGGFGLAFYEYASGSMVRGLRLVGSGANGILVQDAEVAIQSSRLDSCRYAAIKFSGKGAPTSLPGDSGLVGVSTKGNRWSFDLTPVALGRIASNPGLSDSIALGSAPFAAESSTWNTQPVPFVVSGALEVDGGASLVIGAGNRFFFKPSAYLDVGYSGTGSLAVAGTAAAPVEFLPQTAVGWGYSTGTTTGFCLKFYDGTIGADLTYLKLSGAPSNGIVFGGPQRSVGTLDNVEVQQLADPVQGTYGLLVAQGTASPVIKGFTGTKSP